MYIGKRPKNIHKKCFLFEAHLIVKFKMYLYEFVQGYNTIAAKLQSSWYLYFVML